MTIFRFCPRCGAQLPSVEGSTDRVLSQTCAGCDATHYRNAKPSVSTVVGWNGKIVLARRAHDPYLGWWNLPGGFLEPWEHPADGAAREMAEETGLVVRPTRHLAVAVYRYGVGGDYILNHFYRAEVVGGELRPNDEATEVRWFAPDDLPTEIAFLHDRTILETESGRAEPAGSPGTGLAPSRRDA